MAAQPNKPARTTLQTRALTFDIEAMRSSDEGIPVTVSSDAVVNVFDGPEVLVHSPDSIDLSRAPLPIIATHKMGQLNVGLVDSLHVADGKLRGVARFGNRPEAVGYRDDVMSGNIRSVSAGYERKKGYVRNDGVLMTTQWMPTHAAMVAEPADINAGFYRSAAGQEFVPTSEDSRATTAVRDADSQPAAPAASTRGLAMSDVNTAAAGATAATGLQTTNLPDGTMVERLRTKGLDALKRNHDVPADVHLKWVDEGTTVDEASQQTLAMIAERAKRSSTSQPARVGMNDGDVKRYSISRAIRANFEKSWPKVAPFEAEISQALAARMGKQTGEHSFFVPVEVQEAMALGRGQRDLNVATSTLGGYLVATQVQGFIDLLRNRSVVMRMGATLMPGLTGSVSVPKLTGAATAYWFASEAGTATESTPTVGQMTLIPKTVGGYVEVSRQLLLQTAYNADAIVNGDLAQVIGLAVDTAAIAGPGTAGQPTGVMNVTGVGTAAPSTGTAVNYADMIRFQTTVAGSNAFFPGFGYVTTPTVAGVLMGKSRFTNSDTPIWQGMISDGTVVGAPAMTSLQIGSGTVLAGDFSKIVIGEWGVLEIEANPYAQFQAGIIGIRALYTVDVGVRYGAAFAQGTGFIS